MSGRFVAVVGPSGVGKDSLILYARERLGDGGKFHFVRRVVTRPADGNTEDHDTLTPAEFAAAEARGHFALSWDAHGLRYGLPIAIEDDLREGKVVIANLSRRMIPALVERYPDAVVVLVTATRDVIATRLANRGRETIESIQARLARKVDDHLPANTVRIDNSGELQQAGKKFVSMLQDCAGLVAHS